MMLQIAALSMVALAQDQVPRKLPVLVDENQRWPNGVVRYDLSEMGSFIHKRNARRYIKQMQAALSSTCVTFAEASSGVRIKIHDAYYDPNHPTIREMCSSQVGYKGISYTMYLTRDCLHSAGTLMHEFGHAMGLAHTQHRADRDDHVKISLENARKDTYHNFSKDQDDGWINYTHFGLPYDYNSIMHYEEHSFSINNKETISSLNGKDLGQRVTYSPQDIELIRLAYHPICGSNGGGNTGGNNGDNTGGNNGGNTGGNNGGYTGGNCTPSQQPNTEGFCAHEKSLGYCESFPDHMCKYCKLYGTCNNNGGGNTGGITNTDDRDCNNEWAKCSENWWKKQCPFKCRDQRQRPHRRQDSRLGRRSGNQESNIIGNFVNGVGSLFGKFLGR